MQFFSPSRFATTKMLFCLLCLLASAGGLQAVDSSEQFLSAYQACQEGEKLEREGNTQDALKKYWYSESLLEEIVKNDRSSVRRNEPTDMRDHSDCLHNSLQGKCSS